MRIRFLGHASFIIEDRVRIAIDPYDIKTKSPELQEKCDFIFITHAHYDHCSPEDVSKLSDPAKTLIIAPPDCTEKVASLAARILEVIPGTAYNQGIRFKTIPAYNVGKPFHPKENNWVGYLIYLTESLYHCGDTDLIPEMKELKADILLIPVGGTYTMNTEEALKAIELISPRKVIPMHYGKIVGDRTDAEFLKSHSKTPVEILEPEP